jgi:hypothetical protein
MKVANSQRIAKRQQGACAQNKLRNSTKWGSENKKGSPLTSFTRISDACVCVPSLLSSSSFALHPVAAGALTRGSAFSRCQFSHAYDKAACNIFFFFSSAAVGTSSHGVLGGPLMRNHRWIWCPLHHRGICGVPLGILFWVQGWISIGASSSPLHSPLLLLLLLLVVRCDTIVSAR